MGGKYVWSWKRGEIWTGATSDLKFGGCLVETQQICFRKKFSKRKMIFIKGKIIVSEKRKKQSLN